MAAAVEMAGTTTLQVDPMEAELPVPEEPEEEEAPKPKKKRLRFTENDLAGERGIDRLYEDFPGKFKYHGKGHEASDLNALIQGYKEWAFALFPGLHFDDMIPRLESMGKKAVVAAAVEALREREMLHQQKKRHKGNADAGADAGADASAEPSVRRNLEEVAQKLQQHAASNGAEASSDDSAELTTKQKIERNRLQALEKLAKVCATSDSLLHTLY